MYDRYPMNMPHWRCKFDGCANCCSIIYCCSTLLLYVPTDAVLQCVLTVAGVVVCFAVCVYCCRLLQYVPAVALLQYESTVAVCVYRDTHEYRYQYTMGWCIVAHLWFPLQYTARHCNTLQQHVAQNVPHIWFLLQYTATPHCNTVQQYVARFSVTIP